MTGLVGVQYGTAFDGQTHPIAKKPPRRVADSNELLRWSRSGRGCGRFERRGPDDIQLGEILFQIGTPSLAHQGLIGPPTVGSALPVAAVQLIHDVHAVSHHAERREPVFVQRCVVPKIDEDLGRPGIGTRGRKGHSSATIAFDMRIVSDVGLFPGRGNFGVRAQSKLRHKAGNNAKESRAVVVVMLNEVVETVRAVRRPRPCHLDREVARCSDEFDVVLRRSLLSQRLGMQESRVEGRCLGRRSGLFGRRAGRRLGLTRCGKGAAAKRENDDFNKVTRVTHLETPPKVERRILCRDSCLLTRISLHAPAWRLVRQAPSQLH